MQQQVLLVSDIFGLCKGLQQLQQNLAATGAAVQLIDPYQGVVQQFTDEAQAYAAYSTQCGHGVYAKTVMQVLACAAKNYDVVVGFSAGATALWWALSQCDNATIKQAVLFYPGQIHRYMQLNPKATTHIVFGDNEPHFNVVDMCEELQIKERVTAVTTSFAHGFMNPASKAFNQEGYQQYLALLSYYAA